MAAYRRVYDSHHLQADCQEPVLGSQPASDVSHKPSGRLPLLSAILAVTPATLKRAATVIWQRRDCDLIPGPSVLTSSMLTTLLPSHWWQECQQLKIKNLLSVLCLPPLWNRPFHVVYWITVRNSVVHNSVFVPHSVLFFSCPRSEGWPHRGRTFSIYPYPLSFWLTFPRRVLSTSWCCPSRPCVAFFAFVHLALFLALCLSSGNSLFCSWSAPEPCTL